MIRLQRCEDCGAAQYPPREVCAACLSDRLAWRQRGLACRAACWLAPDCITATNRRFRPRLPLTVGLVQFDAGPVAVCFLAAAAAPGDTVQVRTGADDLLEAA